MWIKRGEEMKPEKKLEERNPIHHNERRKFVHLVTLYRHNLFALTLHHQLLLEP